MGKSFNSSKHVSGGAKTNTPKGTTKGPTPAKGKPATPSPITTKQLPKVPANPNPQNQPNNTGAPKK